MSIIIPDVVLQVTTLTCATKLWKSHLEINLQHVLALRVVPAQYQSAQTVCVLSVLLHHFIKLSQIFSHVSVEGLQACHDRSQHLLNKDPIHILLLIIELLPHLKAFCAQVQMCAYLSSLATAPFDQEHL